MTTQKAWLGGMNAEQAAAIAHTDGPLYVGAVAGCGKTRCLVNRIGRMVSGGIPAERILAVTFSKKAADEMNRRLAHDLGIEQARVGTWHSLALQVLREGGAPQGAWNIDEKERHRVHVKEALGYKHLDWKRADVTKVQAFIGICKAHLWGHDGAEAKAEAVRVFRHEASYAVSAYRISDELTHGLGLLTFDDMLVFCARHLQVDDHAAEWAARWDYCMVDEAQDNSPVQLAILDALARGHRNVMAVGDVAQAIYSFRGSSPLHLAGFSKAWGATDVLMNRNYRSGRKIVAAANRAIAPAAVRLPVEMVAERDADGSAEALSVADLDDEADHFTAWVKEHVRDGGKHCDCTALFRTNAQSRALEESLLKARIPYVVVGGTSFYERREVKDLLAYLRVATGRDREGDAVKRCINAPFRYLGRAFVDRAMEEAARSTGERDWARIVVTAAGHAGIQRRQMAAAEQWASLVEDVAARVQRPREPGDDKPSAILADLVRATGYSEWLTKEEGEESIENSRVANVRELIRVAERFPTVAELLDYIEASIQAAKRQRDKKGGDRVLLMSIHRSKGLEWPRVWVVGCVEGILPHARGDREEERRLFYVAVTRARDALVCSHPRSMATASGVKPFQPSAFLVDAGLLAAHAEEAVA